MTMPTEPIRDVMRRTMANLAFIERHKSDSGPYEVTQLINSFLGALAHPWEDMKSELRHMGLANASARGWPRSTRNVLLTLIPNLSATLCAGRPRANFIWQLSPPTGSFARCGNRKSDKADCLDATPRLGRETARGRGTSRKARCWRARAWAGLSPARRFTSSSH
jgi:hypothetical protein